MSIDWSLLSNKQQEEARAAILYIENDNQVSHFSRNDLAESIDTLAKLIARTGTQKDLSERQRTVLKQKRNQLYTDINDSLFAKRDQLINSQHIDRFKEQGDQVNDFINNPEGADLIHNFIILNQSLVKTVIHRTLAEMQIDLNTRSFTLDDLIHIANYGDERKVERKRKFKNSRNYIDRENLDNKNNEYRLGQSLMSLFLSYEDDKGAKFMTYAYHSMRGNLKQYIFNNKYDKLKILWPAENERLSFSDRRGKPVNFEIELDDDINPLDRIEHYTRNSREENALLDERGTNPFAKTIVEDPMETSIAAEQKTQLSAALENLQRQEQEILTMRYGLSGQEPLTLKETGDIYDRNKERIRQIQARAEMKLSNDATLNEVSALHDFGLDHAAKRLQDKLQSLSHVQTIAIEPKPSRARS